MSTIGLTLLSGATLLALIVIAARHVVAESMKEGPRPPRKPAPPTTFTCPECHTGPWHCGWGGLCPNCTGAD
jgi:hypothetical protein